MKTRDISENYVEIVAEEGCGLLRKGDEPAPNPPKRAKVRREDAEAWTEIALKDAPQWTREDYRAEVCRLVAEQYDATREAGILREALSLLLPQAANANGVRLGHTEESADAVMEAFGKYNAFVESCKVQAVANLAGQAGAEMIQDTLKAISAGESDEVSNQ